MMTAPNAAPKNIATTDSTLLANLGLLPFAIEESARMRLKLSLSSQIERHKIDLGLGFGLETNYESQSFPVIALERMAGTTRLELVTSAVTAY
jgi:hypothetical protein